MSKKPVHEVRLGVVKATIWENETEGGSIRHSVQIAKLYKDDADQWQQTKSFSRDDLPLVAKVADMVHTWIYEQRQVERKDAVAV